MPNPIATLGQLYSLACSELALDSRNNIESDKPHGVPAIYNITNVALLCFTHCTARVQCTCCFECAINENSRARKVLVQFLDDDTESGSKRKLSSPSREIRRKSYWHLPLTGLFHDKSAPQKSTAISEQVDSQGGKKSSSISDDVFTSQKVYCPNDCPAKYCKVIWECSGVIDDGTGQAKFIAEHSVVLSLLGKEFDKAKVEEGAWMDMHGISYYHGEALHPDVLSACKNASEQLRNWKKSNPEENNPPDALDFLRPETRAEVLLYCYCSQKHINENLRLKLSLHCKFRTSTNSLRNTQIRTVAQGVAGFRECATTIEVNTFALPLIKLEIEQVLPTESNVKEQCWELISKMQSQTIKHN